MMPSDYWSDLHDGTFEMTSPSEANPVIEIVHVGCNLRL